MKNNIGLVEHAKKALAEKWGYVWGTFGQVLTPALFNLKVNQYPEGVGNYKDFIQANWLNRRTADCVGLIKSFIWWNGSDPVYTPATDVSADGMYNAAKEKGPLNNMPDIPGICLWHKGHIGIYIGNGQVIEAHGTKYGVIQTPLRGAGATSWAQWLKCPYISYDGAVASNDLYLGCAGSLVIDLQVKLNKIGYNLVADGDFGPKTDAAVKNFQANNNLVADGVVGETTMKAIDAMIVKLEKPKKTFEDIVREVSEGSAEEWIIKMDAMQKAAEADGDLGAFEFCKFFKALVVKAYYHK